LKSYVFASFVCETLSKQGTEIATVFDIDVITKYFWVQKNILFFAKGNVGQYINAVGLIYDTNVCYRLIALLLIFNINEIDIVCIDFV